MKQNNRSNHKGMTATQQNSGSQYHEEHAGNVTGYGEMDPVAEGGSNMSDQPNSTS
ncbi:hypothetical protein RCG24_05730 [Neobacillus sp. OS1-32]|uniref:hypothetical protein n=1 Tax=Neobacillus sp. OS1-32 TaxID=3070682 RepID=UPI0027E19EB8|nr:hypothetical protein [Neobacillus sp. OS1-32]WML31372.1 hypothetical protein RCG24_05730 [Neobacillus sp. OS1-32]